MLFSVRFSLLQQFINACHLVDGLIEVKMQFWNDTQLMALQVSHLATNFRGVCLHLRNHACYFVLWKDAQIDVCNAQVG